MLDLDSPRWGGLVHAYGNASDIPELLRQLSTLPPCDLEKEPWATLWSALAHQGDVYSASFAAVPHVVAALATDPLKADSTYFQFPAWVECCRARNNVVMPDDLVMPYRRALSRLPQLIADASRRPWDEEFMQCALAALAAAKGAAVVAEAAMELDAATAKQFLEWLRNR
ncbi:hypothetical protein [Rhodanobacter sp. DHG33]|uniref:hypothetical protein n=1 Tax=Rhodanobacter sp. DHG33 TaxID=2775921 RepID=UPI00177F7854|nr:hypothetical protein [Rhodanobacter sp. DHG33]MBD8900194.1 hypothetical protein [Rhodanobacter sp. DHG33]